MLCLRCNEQEAKPKSQLCQDCAGKHGKRIFGKAEPQGWHPPQEAPNAAEFTGAGSHEVTYTPEQDAWIRAAIEYRSRRGVKFMHAVHWLELAREFFGVK
jgi:hypothetical protein